MRTSHALGPPRSWTAVSAVDEGTSITTSSMRVHASPIMARAGSTARALSSPSNSTRRKRGQLEAMRRRRPSHGSMPERAETSERHARTSSRHAVQTVATSAAKLHPPPAERSGEKTAEVGGPADGAWARQCHWGHSSESSSSTPSARPIASGLLSYSQSVPLCSRQ